MEFSESKDILHLSFHHFRCSSNPCPSQHQTKSFLPHLQYACYKKHTLLIQTLGTTAVTLFAQRISRCHSTRVCTDPPLFHLSRSALPDLLYNFRPYVSCYSEVFSGKLLQLPMPNSASPPTARFGELLALSFLLFPTFDMDRLCIIR